MSLAYGATGTALFLKQVDGALQEELERWLLGQPLSEESYPPGLWVGLAGIAYGAGALGYEARADEAVDLCYKSHLLYEEASMFHGMAGWGLVSLSFLRRTGADVHRRMAGQAVDGIVRSAIVSDGGAHWRSSLDDHVHYGYGYGSSGIGWFLLCAGLMLGREDAVRLAEKALTYDIANRFEDRFGWTWFPHTGRRATLPYWAEGGAGVGTVALRYWQLLGEPRYLDWALTIADAVSVRWAMLPSLADGMAGIGEYLLDVYLATGDHTFLARANEIADAISWYLIERPDGLAAPGRFLDRASFDLASGSAGIGLFVDRLARQGPRLLVDLVSMPGSRGSAALL